MKEDPQGWMGIGHQLFNFTPHLDAKEYTPSAVNIFQGLCGEEATQQFNDRHNVTLSKDQCDCADAINKSDCTWFLIRALAGTGKTMLASFLLESIMPEWVGTNKAETCAMKSS